jgi:hypothetical protein
LISEELNNRVDSKETLDELNQALIVHRISELNLAGATEESKIELDSNLL